MKKEQKYTSLELSKKIYELAKKKGIELESEYYWIIDNKTGEKALGKPSISPKLLQCERYSYYPALDTAELGMILPDNTLLHIGKSYRECFIRVIRISKKTMTLNNPGIEFLCKTEAEARGQLYFYLLDNNLL